MCSFIFKLYDWKFQQQQQLNIKVLDLKINVLRSWVLEYLVIEVLGLEVVEHWKRG